MPGFIFKCPKCSEDMEVDEDAAKPGGQVRCPYCKSMAPVPAEIIEVAQGDRARVEEEHAARERKRAETAARKEKRGLERATRKEKRELERAAARLGAWEKAQDLKLQDRHEQAREQDRREHSMARCPKCGSEQVQAISEGGKSYDKGCGLIGCLFLGPLGLLFGLLGATPDKLKWVCMSCGWKYLPPRQQD